MNNEITNESLQQLKALAKAATPGPWYVQFGDDIRHQCMTAISTVNKRDGNDGLFDDDQPLIAVTFHQSYPGVNLEGDDCGDNDSAYIAAANPASILALIAKVESLAADAGRQKLPNKSDLIDKIRSFGFTTYGQSVQLAYAIIDMAKEKA